MGVRKVNLWYCDACGSIYESDELPDGWYHITGGDVTREQYHICNMHSLKEYLGIR